jgi:hypothetical protein
VYQKQYGGFLLSQSGEAKCNLYTAQEGHTTLNLRKCEYHVRKSAPFVIPFFLQRPAFYDLCFLVTTEDTECQYPEWMRRHRKYLSLGRDTLVHFNHKGTSLAISSADPTSLFARSAYQLRG